MSLDDNDDIMLSQALDFMESAMANEKCKSENEDDILLSQALDLMESRPSAARDRSYDCQSYDEIEINLTHTLCEIEKMENETLSQMMNSYDVQLTDNTFGNFNLRLNDVTGDTTGTLDDSSVVKSEEPDGDSSLTDRFATETTCEDANALINEQKSKNTVRNTKWAYTVFESWRDTRNKSGHEIPELSNMTVDDMNTYLCRFVMETRKRDGTKYPPNSLYHIMSGLLRYLRDKNINDKNFLDQADPRFSYLNKVLNSEMKKLTSEGLALPQREALPVTETDERQIWEKGVFGDFDAISLQRTVFFYNCKIFGLRAADEHRDLTTDQFTIGEEDGNGLYVDFNGKTSKTYSGSVKQRKLEPKQIRHYDNGSGLVKLYEMYLSCVKTECENKTFYKRALPRVGENKFRFSENVVGINKLRSFMKEICKAAGLDGRYTNHSGKKTCATSLYQKGIQEQEIMRRTGHRSIAGVRKYQKASNEMLKDVSNILNPKVSFMGGADMSVPPKLDVKEVKPKLDETDTKPDVTVSSELFKSNTSAQGSSQSIWDGKYCF